MCIFFCLFVCFYLKVVHLIDKIDGIEIAISQTVLLV